MPNTSQNKTSKRRKILYFLGTLLLAAVFYVRLQPLTPTSSDPSTPNTSTIHFSQSENEADWPLSGIKSGEVYCEEYAVVFRNDQDGQVYGLNGAALSYARAKGYDWKPIGDVQIVGKDISFMLDQGKQLCK